MRDSIQTSGYWSRHFVFCTFLVYWAYWILVGLPALTQPFLYLDDYNIYDPAFTPSNILTNGFYNARPMLGVYFQLFFWDRPPDWNGLNIVVTVVQMAAHALAGAFFAAVFRNYIGVLPSILCGFLFVGWPLHFEPVLWYAACLYPFGAVWAAGGLYLAERWRPTDSPIALVLAGICTLLGVFSSQTSGVLGAALLPSLIGMRWLQAKPLDIRREGVVAATLYGGMIAAGLFTVILLKIGGLSRIQPTGWGDRLQFLGLQFNKYLQFPQIYPHSMIWMHWLLLIFGGICLVLPVVFKGKTALRWIVVPVVTAIVGLAGCGANFVSGDLYPSYRILYGLPLMGTVWMAFAFSATTQLVPFIRFTCVPNLLRAACVFILGLTVGIYTPWLRKGSSELVELFNRDREQLALIQSTAVEEGFDQVLFMDWVNSRPWNPNPYQLRFKSLGVLRSVLHSETSNYRAIEIFTELTSPPWPEWERLRKKHSESAMALPGDQLLKFLPDREENVLIVVPR